MENYSLSDLASVTKGNDGFGGNMGFFWIFALLLLANGGFGGIGTRGDYGAFATSASQQDILFGQKFSDLDNKIDRLGNGIADATFALNNAITSEGRATQTQLANCCCENQRNVDALRYDMTNQINAVNANTTAQMQKILDVISQNKIESLQAQVNALQLQNTMAGVVKYPMATTYTSGSNPFCSCGCSGF